MSLGLVNLPWWGYVVFTLLTTHVTIIAVTVYLHRCQAHRALDLHPAVAHFFRLWLWLTTGMETRQWIAVHRKHHAKVETAEDPHSPKIFGIRRLLLEGAELYRAAIRKQDIIDRYGHGAPEDWLERNVYAAHSDKGFLLLLAIDVVMFGPIGLTVWAVQMLWIPVLAAGVINGVGHYWGYRNFETADASTNIVPVGIIIGGEELHNNHHAFASSAKFSVKSWEIDVGWLYIRVLAALGLARVKKVAPVPVLVDDKTRADDDTVSAIITNRFQVMARYAKTVLARVHAEELAKLGADRCGALRSARRLLVREESLLTGDARARLEAALGESPALATVYAFKQRLQALWMEHHASHDRLLQVLEQWCREAEESGIRALQDFARTLPRYSLAAA